MAVKGTLAQYVNSGRIAIGDVRFPEELIEALIGRKQPKDNANLTEAEVLGIMYWQLVEQYGPKITAEANRATRRAKKKK
jgi:hypothetical protein